MQRRLLWIGVSVLGALGALAALWIIPDLEERPLVVDVKDIVPVRHGDPPDALRFAIAPLVVTDGVHANLEPLGRRLSQLLGRPVRIVQRRRYQELNDLLRAGDVHVAMIDAGAYLRARREGINLEIIAVPYHSKGPTVRSLTIVRARSPIESFEALRGRPFAFTDPLSRSGHDYPLEWAIDAGFDPASFFRQATFTYGQVASIAAVLDGEVAGAAVDGLAFDAEIRRRPDLAERLRVVHASPPLATSPVVMLTSVDHRLARQLQVALLDLARTPDGRETLRAQGIERFVEPPANLFAEEQRRFDALVDELEPER